jgi:hypothetical protein
LADNEDTYRYETKVKFQRAAAFAVSFPTTNDLIAATLAGQPLTYRVKGAGHRCAHAQQHSSPREVWEAPQQILAIQWEISAGLGVLRAQIGLLGILHSVQAFSETLPILRIPVGTKFRQRSNFLRSDFSHNAARRPHDERARWYLFAFG